LKTKRRFTTHFSTGGSKTMNARYFQDTDTLYLEFKDSIVVETRDLDEDTILDYDAEGKIVGITIEHARSRVGGPEIRMETVGARCCE
jgi:uncharacterized protein YuzE